MLSDTKVKNTKPAARPAKLSDGGGMYLLVSPAGGKWWRLNYRFGGKFKTLALGVYPDVSLKQARERRDEARKLIASGVDPGAARKAERAASGADATNTFEAIAREWIDQQAGDWSERHKEECTRLLHMTGKTSHLCRFDSHPQP